MPKVSIIIPMYNSARTIERALVSVYNQTFQDFEVLIIDDGSIDHCGEIAQHFISQKELGDSWRVIKQENGGPSKARNHGMNVAKGQYIAFLDADDEWMPHKTEMQLQYINDNSELWLTGAPHSTIATNREISFKALLMRNYFLTSSIIMRNSPQYRFNENQKYSEDYRLWLTIAFSHKCGLIGGKVVIYDGGTPQKQRSGLSTRKWAMEKGELSNFSYLIKNKKINIFTYCLCCLFSLIKFVKRLIL